MSLLGLFRRGGSHEAAGAEFSAEESLRGEFNNLRDEHTKIVGQIGACEEAVHNNRITPKHNPVQLEEYQRQEGIYKNRIIEKAAQLLPVLRERGNQSGRDRKLAKEMQEIKVILESALGNVKAKIASMQRRLTDLQANLGKGHGAPGDSHQIIIMEQDIDNLQEREKMLEAALGRNTETK